MKNVKNIPNCAYFITYCDKDITRNDKMKEIFERYALHVMRQPDATASEILKSLQDMTTELKNDISKDLNVNVVKNACKSASLPFESTNEFGHMSYWTIGDTTEDEYGNISISHQLYHDDNHDDNHDDTSIIVFHISGFHEEPNICTDFNYEFLFTLVDKYGAKKVYEFIKETFSDYRDHFTLDFLDVQTLEVPICPITSTDDIHNIKFKLWNGPEITMHNDSYQTFYRLKNEIKYGDHNYLDLFQAMKKFGRRLPVFKGHFKDELTSLLQENLEK